MTAYRWESLIPILERAIECVGVPQHQLQDLLGKIDQQQVQVNTYSFLVVVEQQQSIEASLNLLTIFIGTNHQQLEGVLGDL